jgi:O-antigen/teichoic acid export membrane protein
MGVIKQQSIKNAFVIYSGLGLGYLNVVVLFPKFFTPEEFGLTRLLLSFANIMTVVSHFGFTNVAVRYFPYFRDYSNNHQGFLFWLLVVPLGGFLLFSGGLWLFKPLILGSYKANNALFVEHFFWILPLTLFLLYFKVLFSYSKALFQTVVPLFFKEVGIRLLITLAILLTVLGQISFEEFLALFVLMYSLLAIGMVFYLSYIGELALRPHLQGLSLSYFKSMFKYGFFTQATMVSSLLNRQVDILMLGAMVGGKAVGIYTMAFYLCNVVTIPQRGIKNISSAVIANAFARNDLSQIRELYQRSALNQMLVGAFIFMVIWFNVEDILYIVNPEYVKGVYVVLFVGLAKVFAMATGVNNQILKNSSYYKYSLLFILNLLLLTVVFNLIFIPQLGIVGAALGTTLAPVLNNLLKSGLIWYKLAVHPLSFNQLWLLLIIGIVAVVGFVLPDLVEPVNQFYRLTNIACKSAALAVLYGGLILLIRPSEDVWESVVKAKARFLG